MHIVLVIIFYCLNGDNALLRGAGSPWRLGFVENLENVDFLLAVGNKWPGELYQPGTLAGNRSQWPFY